eukprot:TRINITY_DN63433_c0_g1_i1.p1 TRINITY_DN63433_c0_g1~~TRINITY_DN63433_c0_g1_i1.p1  ORF type:complete len:156 (+),score=41.38 TRINITY_DN63433_c0_g1_i1:272-739(+)
MAVKKVMKKAMKAKAKAKSKSGSSWELKPFSSKERKVWKNAVLSVQKQLKSRKREHPALFMLGAVGKHLYESVKSIYRKSGNKKWDLKAFTAKEGAAWEAAVKDAQRQLKKRKRQHPALFMLAQVGKHLYEAPQSLYTRKALPPKKAMKAMKAMK